MVKPENNEHNQTATESRRRYSTSKLFNVLTTYKLCRLLQESGVQNISVNAFDPVCTMAIKHVSILCTYTNIS